MKKKKVAVDDRVYGKWSGCGYPILEDGKYQVSDSVRRSMDETIEQERGMRLLADSFNAFAAKRFAEITREQKRWWNGIKEDLELDFNKVTCVYTDGILEITPKPVQPISGDSNAAPPDAT